MDNITPIHSNKIDNSKLTHVVEYEQFIAWVALPKSLKNPKTQAELAKQIGVGPDTLSEWKQRHGFWDRVNEQMKIWAKEKTPDVISILYEKILKTGGASEIRIWLEWQKEIDSNGGISKELDDVRQSFKNIINRQREKQCNDF